MVETLALTPRPEHRAGYADMIGGVLMVAVSAIIFLLNTYRGIGVLPDTTRYMGLGPMPSDAPLYSWALDAIRLSGMSFARGAWILAFLLVCANTWLIWQLLLRGTGKLPYAAAATALITLSPQFVGFHAVAMSEAPFLFAILILLFAFLEYLQTERKFWLLVSGVVLGLAMLARFTAAAMAIALATFLLLDPRRAVQQRVMDIIILAIVSGAIFFGWAAISELTTGRAIGRDFVLYGNADLDRWLHGLATLTMFLLPGEVPSVLRILLFVGVCGFLLWLFIKHGRETRAKAVGGTSPGDAALPLLLGLFAFCYVVFMVAAVSFEANLTIGARYMLPVYMALVIAGACLFATDTAIRSNAALGWALCGFVALIVASDLARTVDRTRENHAKGIGYASTAWATSPVIQAVNRLPANAVIFSNAPDALNYLTPRKTSFIPWKVHPRTNREDPERRLEYAVDLIRSRLAAGDGYIVILDQVDWRFYSMTEGELIAAVHPKLIRQEADGRIYGPAPTAELQAIKISVK